MYEVRTLNLTRVCDTVCAKIYVGMGYSMFCHNKHHKISYETELNAPGLR